MSQGQPIATSLAPVLKGKSVLDGLSILEYLAFLQKALEEDHSACTSVVAALNLGT
jgi:hypothetical protein